MSDLTQEAAARFVDAFQDYWSQPSPDRMGEILTDDVVLIQPLSEPLQGLEAAQGEFRRLFAWLPDLTARVDHWAYREGVLFIEFRLSATLEEERVEWSLVDRFTLRDGKASKRVSYFDPLPLLARVGKAPSSWWGWWKSGAARPWAGRVYAESDD